MATADKIVFTGGAAETEAFVWFSFFILWVGFAVVMLSGNGCGQ